MLELKVLMLNINKGNNEELKENCRSLKEYMQFVDKVRNFYETKKLEKKDAVEMAVTECIKEGILEAFLRRNRAEVVSVSIFEFDEEKEWKKIRESEYQYGVEDGIEQGIERGLEALIVSMKKIHTNVEDIYHAVIENDIYKDVTKEQVEQFFIVNKINLENSD